jgi:hypothetical protein
MILDTYKLHTVIVQVTYPEAFELWDRAGAVARRTTAIWPGLELDTSSPNEQMFRSPTVVIQTGFRTSIITLSRPKLDPATMTQIAQTYEVWQSELQLSSLTRVSCRSKYVKEFSSQREANLYLLNLGVVTAPEGRVFDQPHDGKGNSIEVGYRFEDEASFAVLRVGGEHLNIEMRPNPELETEAMKKQRFRAIIDFDRGLLSSLDAKTLRMDEWLKGYQHLLRRDLEKVIRARAT